VAILSPKDLATKEVLDISRRLRDTADFLEHFFRWDWYTRDQNPRNAIIAELRWTIRHRTGRPHDAELSALIDAAYRAAGIEEGCYIDATALDKIEKREKEGRVKATRRLRSRGSGSYMFYP